KESSRVREISLHESHPPVCISPRAGAFIEIFAWSVKSARDYSVPDTFSGPLITECFREVLAVKTPLRRYCRLNLVFMNKFDPLAMCKPMVLGIQIEPLIHDRLQGLVVD